MGLPAFTPCNVFAPDLTTPYPSEVALIAWSTLEEAYLQNLENKYINLIKSKLETKNLKITLDNATLLQAIEEFLSQKKQVIYKGFKNKLKLYFLTALKWSLFLIIPTLYLYYSFLLKGINTIDAIFLVDATKSLLDSFSMGYAVRHLIKTEFSISLETQDFPRLKEFIKNKYLPHHN